MLDAGAPHGDEGELGGDEEPVGEDEGDDGEQRKRGTNRNILTLAGGTSPGTRGDRRPMRPGSLDDCSVIFGGEQRSACVTVAQALLG